tara:strand:+ start:4471 stop:5931 length:1461 start_codon:yes stop_codon:yes gene_type:complete
MERTLPKSINYQDVLPLSVPAIARRRRFYPQNGTSFNVDGTQEIRIQIESPNSLLDAQMSYLEFEVVNNTTGGGAKTFGFDQGGGAVMFQTVRVEQGGRVLSEIQAHNRLHATLLDPVQVSSDGKVTESLTQGQRGFNSIGGFAGAVAPAAAGLSSLAYANCRHNMLTQVPAGAAYRFTMPIVTGLFTQDKLIPLPLVRQDAPLTISLIVSVPDDVGVWDIQPVNTDLSIRKISYTAQLIEVGRDVIDQMRTVQSMMNGKLAISGQDWEHYQGELPGASTGEQIVRMPSRKRSINSLFWTAQSNDYTNGAGALARWNIYNLSYGGSANVDSFQLKVGSVVYPPTPIQAQGVAGAAAALQRGEAVMELAKAFGTLGFVNPTGRLNTLTYGTDNGGMGDGDNGDGLGGTIAPGTNEPTSVCPFGVDLTSFQHEALEAGVDTETLSQETNLILNINAAGSGVESKVVHQWIIYDQHYYFNANGMITFSN